MLIEISVEEFGPPTGLLRDVSRDVSIRFCGWLELLAILGDLVGSAGDEQHEPGPGVGDLGL